MTIIHLRRMALLHGVPDAITHLPLTRKKFLQACNNTFATTDAGRQRMNAFKRATNQKIPRGIPKRGHKKCVIAPYRLAHRDKHWLEIKQALFDYAYKDQKLIPGRLTEIAKYIGCSLSQVHRWLCPICEHDNEPSFSLGMAIVEFLEHKF